MTKAQAQLNKPQVSASAIAAEKGNRFTSLGRRVVLLLQHTYFWRAKRGTKPTARLSFRKGTASQHLPAARATHSAESTS